MRVDPYHLAQCHPTDAVFAPSRLNAIVGSVIVLLFTAGGVFFITHGGFILGWIFAIAGGGLWVYSLAHVAMTLGPNSWFVRWDGSRLLIKTTALISGDSNIPVITLERADIQSMRQHCLTTTRYSRDSDGDRTTRTEHHWSLEILLANHVSSVDVENLRGGFRKAQDRKNWLGFRVRSLPVQVVDPCTLRLDWKTPNQVISPSLSETLAFFANEFPTTPGVSEEVDFRKTADLRERAGR